MSTTDSGIVSLSLVALKKDNMFTGIIVFISCDHFNELTGTSQLKIIIAI